jgi:hypothetical protein
MIGKKVPTKDNTFRLEISRAEIEEQQSKSSPGTNFWADWVNSAGSNTDKEWEALSEEEKADYQKKHYITEQYYYYKNEKGETVPYMRWTLNTDWTWDIWDMEKGIEYRRCYPASMKNEDIIEEVLIDYSFTKKEKE